MFGYPEAKRVFEIQDKLKSTNETYSVYYQGKYRQLPVVELHIEVLMYRMENIRTKNLQKEWLTVHPEHEKDFFRRDPYSIEVQEAQHALLKQLANKEKLLETFKKGKMQQTEPLICSDNGIVVNGNRRLCAWRELFYAEKDKYSHFEMIRVAVLPNHDQNGMYDLEVDLQIQTPMKADYAWHAIAADYKEKADMGLDVKVIASKQRKSAEEVNTFIECYDYAAQYLEAISHPDEWSRVDKQYYAFKEIVKGRKIIKNPGDKELFQEITNSILSVPAEGDRLYNQIPKVVKNLEIIAPKLKDVFETEIEEISVDDDLDLLGEGDQGDIDTTNAQLAAGIRIADDPQKVVSIVKNIVESCDELEKEKKKQNFVFSQVVNAATALNNAVSNLDDSMSKQGIEKQIENIEASCAILKDWILK